MQNLKVKIFTKEKKYEYDYEVSEDMASDLYNEVQDNIFVFIKKEDYESLNEETVAQIDSEQFEFQPQEEKTIEELLNKKVLFVKYNDKEEIKKVLFLRNKISNKTSFIILSSQ